MGKLLQSIKLPGLDEEYVVNHGTPTNFLDNSYFGQMVNQYGTEHATGVGYYIDRWYSNHSFMSVGPMSHAYDNGSIVNLLGIGNMNLEGVSTQNAILSQQIEPVKSKYMRGRTFTFAVKKLDGTVVVCSGVCSRGTAPENATEEDLIQFSAEVNSGYLAAIDVYKNPETNNFEARIKVSPGGQVYLLWAALYEGEYTVDTLPAYQPKGYAAELLECRRYYYVLSNSLKTGIISEDSNGTLLRLGIPLAVTMRATPTMTIKTADGLRMVVGCNETPEILSSSVYLYDDCSIRIDLWITPYLNTIYDTPIALYFSAILDANL